MAVHTISISNSITIAKLTGLHRLTPYSKSGTSAASSIFPSEYGTSVRAGQMSIGECGFSGEDSARRRLSFPLPMTIPVPLKDRNVELL